MMSCLSTDEVGDPTSACRNKLEAQPLIPVSRRPVPSFGAQIGDFSRAHNQTKQSRRFLYKEDTNVPCSQYASVMAEDLDPLRLSSHPRLRGRPSSYLHKACGNCRRRKTGCDGKRPTCTKCSLHPPRTLEPCRYSHTTPDAVGLHTEGIMEEAHRESDISSNRVFLANPYSTTNAFKDASRERLDLLGVPAIQAVMQEPSQSLAENLIEAFLGRFCEDGFFFLEPLRFRRSALLSLLFGHPERPSPGLLSTIYLWGCHISSKDRQPVFDYRSHELLGLAVHHLARDIHGPFIHNPQFALDTIQAEILLSLWYLNSGQTLHGRYHCATATSLAAAHHTNRSPERGSFHYLTLLNPTLPAPRDDIEFTERVNALWAVLVLDKMWLVASGLASTLPLESSAHISAPINNVPPGFPTLSTISQFIEGLDAHSGHPPFVLFAKAAYLLECSTNIGNTFVASPLSSELQTSVESILNLQINTFRRSLPSLAGNDVLPRNQTLLVTHCLTNVASIRLNSPRIPGCPHSTRHAFLAAEQVVSDIMLADVLDWNHADPMFGPLLSSVCSFYLSYYHMLPIPKVTANLHTLFSLMSSLSALSPMIEQCYIATQRYYSAFPEP
ncbi:hypothetical protein B0H19DRAFT_711330 [Mycena capillaripes]|nr:hypothetical protein B0H19DRAFT_711330 [Mycena capillaripes]